MLKVTSCLPAPEGFELTIQYDFITGGKNTEKSVHPDKETAYRHYVTCAIEFLKFSVDDFNRGIWKVKHHYFEKKAVPFFHADDNWRTGFWRFCDLKIALNRLSESEVYQYAQLIQKNLKLIEYLIPSFVELGSKEIRAMFRDIEAVSNSIMVTIRAIQDGTINNQNKVA
jgi:hypothetical protein